MSDADLIRRADGHWDVVGHAAVIEVATDWRRFSSARGTTLVPIGESRPLRSLHISDPPVHAELRGLVERGLGRGWLLPLVERARDRARDIVDGWRVGETVDAIATLAEPIARIGLDAVVGIADAALPDLIRAFARAGGEAAIWPIVERAIATRSSPLIAAVCDAGLDERDLRYLVRLLVQVAYHSSELAIGAAVVLVRGRVEDAMRAADEVLRYAPPVLRFVREVIADTELCGVALRAGERVAMCFPEANRDPRVFAEPEKFDVERAVNPHVAFGAGVHACLGAALARAQIAAVIEALGTRETTVMEARALRTHVNQGYERVVVRVE